jgi:hypothetical protein
MINITNDSDGSISIIGGNYDYLRVRDVVSLLDRYFTIAIKPDAMNAALILEGEHAVIRKDQVIWNGFWDKNGVDLYLWLQNNILPLAVHLNAVAICADQVKHTVLTPMMLNCITDESFIQARTGADVLQLIESSEKISLELRNPNNNSKTSLVFEAEHINAPSFNVKDIGQQLGNMNTSYRNAITRITTQKFKKYKESLEVIKQEAYLDGVNKGISMQSAGWKIIIIAGRKYMNYPGRILVETITDFDDVRYQLPKELVGLFWVQDIIVPVASTITGASAAGFNPHRTDSARGDSLQQLNERHSMCIGDLANAPFNRLSEMVDMYKNINMKSNYGGFSTQVCQHLLGKRQNDLHLYLQDPGTSQHLRDACGPAIPLYGYFKNQPVTAGRAHGEIFGDEDI